ncbi:RHS repeat-associated core domain-containing protein, partial [uncultured Mucilaginibacter sp.]|uniref:RHS repeat domain-containing protein n=1 Tax=uncultured Mucilaginibacter sp. TaxID=797541 RepID=UPI0025DFE44C
DWQNTQPHTLTEDSLVRGSKQYELTNHLGNVLATISDRKIQATTPQPGTSGIAADLLSATDYYAFGMQMPGRNFSGGSYRFGFNGKENDNEVKGDGNEQDYGMRIYDPRLGRFLSVDPLTKKYPELTPYQFASNMPISASDLDGLESLIRTDYYNLSGKLYKTEIDVPAKNERGQEGIQVREVRDFIHNLPDNKNEIIAIESKSIFIKSVETEGHKDVKDATGWFEKVGYSLESKMRGKSVDSWSGVNGMENASAGLNRLATVFGETGVGEPISWGLEGIAGLITTIHDFSEYSASKAGTMLIMNATSAAASHGIDKVPNLKRVFKEAYKKGIEKVNEDVNDKIKDKPENKDDKAHYHLNENGHGYDQDKKTPSTRNP